MDEYYKNKRVLITGAAGTVGKEVVRQLYALNPAEIRALDNNETELYFLMEAYRGTNVFCFLGDVRDEEKIEKHAQDVDVIIHCAAFKHVILCEYNPFDAVQTNIVGVENIIRAAQACGVGNVLFTSSDKAVNPTNVMGTSKLMGERLITAANALANNKKTIFSSTRFGNVIGSRGSVAPIFMRQIMNGGPVTITDMCMTRFVMTIEESAKFVLKSVPMSKGGEVFVTKMPVVRIPDLANAMIEILAPKYGHKPSDIKINEIGGKPGEKLYEELMSTEEAGRSLELDDMFVITPAFKSIYHAIDYIYPNVVATKVGQSYISESGTALDQESLKKYLIDHRVLEQMM